MAVINYAKSYSSGTRDYHHSYAGEATLSPTLLYIGGYIKTYTGQYTKTYIGAYQKQYGKLYTKTYLGQYTGTFLGQYSSCLLYTSDAADE